MTRSRLSCQQTRRELAAGIDGPELEAHVAACSDCAAFGRDAAQLQALAAHLPTEPRSQRRPAGSRLALLMVSSAFVVAIVGLGYVVVSREHRTPTSPTAGVAVTAPDASAPARQAGARQDEAPQAGAPSADKEIDLLAIIDRARSVWLGKREGSATSSGVSDPLALAWLDAGSSTRTSDEGGSDLLGLALDGRLDTLFSSQPSGATSRPKAGGGLR